MSTAPHHGMTELEQLILNIADIEGAFFGRLLPENQITGISRQEALNRLSPIIHGLSDPTDPTSGTVPAGYTFFGQFVDHDVTLDVETELGRVVNPSLVRNVRTPRLDLDCVYGFGPEAAPHLYSGKPGQHGYLLFGNNQNDLDLARTCHGTALIGDPRNDENGIVSQIHGLMIRFANLVLAETQNKGDVTREMQSMAGGVEILAMSADPFEIARTLVRWHYQWVILHDFLPRFVDQEVLDSVIGTFRQHKLPKPFLPNSAVMPVEFSVAGYRFGHATILNEYEMKKGGPKLPLFGVNGIPAFGFKPAGQNMDFDHFLEVPGSTNASQTARPIGLKIAQQLFALPFVGPGNVTHPDLTIPAADNRSLIHRNIYRDRFTLLLPSGQQFAQAIMRSPLSPDNAFQQARLDKIPLFYYLLQEAQTKSGKLGWVGGTIVAGTIIRLLALDEMSVWHHPTWEPLYGADGNAYTLGHLAKWTADSHSNISFWSDLQCPN